MPGSFFRAIASALFAATLTLAAFAVCAQDGPLRQRLRDWQSQRQQPSVNSEPGASTPASLNRPGDHLFKMPHGGLTRLYRVHVPASYNPDRPAPLLVALHGGGGNMDLQADDSRYGLITLSERKGLVVVFPNGYSKLQSGKLGTWNAGNCCGGARDAAVDDIGFIRQVVDHITSQMSIDRQRIFATGMSNGAMMSYRLACEMSDVFRAIAAVAGTDNTRVCRPANPVSVLHIHARDDRHVLFGGGAGPDSVNRAAVTDYVSVPGTISKWAQFNGCTAPPQRILDLPGAYCERYAPCAGGAQVQLCVTESGGHSWPGGQKFRGDQPPSNAISAVDVMWDFFNR